MGANTPSIRIQGARTNNLQGIDVDLPCHELIMITGLSGCGKSSLGFGTLFAEGSLRYLESFSTRARQFLGKMKRPTVKSIQGIMPSVGLSRKGNTENPRASVGTTTDTYTYLKLLYANLGVTFSPVSGAIVKKNTIEDVVDQVARCAKGSQVLIMAPLRTIEGRTWQETLQVELGKGFSRIFHQGKMLLIEDMLAKGASPLRDSTYIIIDRIKVGTFDEVLAARIADSAKTAFFEGKGKCTLQVIGGSRKNFSDLFEADGMTFERPSSHFFSFNSAHGACKTCNGIGQHWGIDRSKVIPNPAMTIREGAIVPWRNARFADFQKDILKQGKLPCDVPYQDLKEEEKRLLWEGDDTMVGIDGFFARLVSKQGKIQHRFFYAQYQGFVDCESCAASGLREEVGYVKIAGKSLIDVLQMPIDALYAFFKELTVPKHQKKVADVLVEEINKRLFYLKKVGLGYLTLNRKTKTLSGGEYQRARLAKILGSPLVDSLYVLDEPTSGLHQRDAAQLVEALVALKDVGNTIVIVGHEELIMRVACSIIDLGPKAGSQGGRLLFQGNWKALEGAKESYTADYLFGRRTIPIPKQRKKPSGAITLKNVTKNNIHNMDVSFPLGVFVAVSGVSGSGKSTLIDEVLYEILYEYVYWGTLEKKGSIEVAGDMDSIQEVVYMKQNTLGRSRRSNVATYIQAYDDIRALFTKVPLAMDRGYTASHFSFNAAEGRCKACAGEGKIKVDMQFMEDLFLTCEACGGKRFLEEVLEVKFHGKNIMDVLEMSVAESLVFFKEYETIVKKLAPLGYLGLEAMKLGQSSNTWSSGEAQRVKLALYLNAEYATRPTFFIFDEPTTGLHFHDIKKLIRAFMMLREQGHSVLVVEHNMEILKSVDWIIDLGPESGLEGGKVVFAGTPEEMITLEDNHTARFLRRKFAA